MREKTKRRLRGAVAAFLAGMLTLTSIPGAVSGLVTVRGEETGILMTSHSYEFKSNTGKETPVMGQILDGTDKETPGIYYSEESTNNVSFDPTLLKFRNGAVLYLPISEDTTKITYKQTCTGDSADRPTYVGRNDASYFVNMNKKEQSVTISDITELIKTVNGQKYIAIYSHGDVKISKMTLVEYNPVNRVQVSGIVTGAAENGITEISFKNIQTEEITKAVIDENGAYSAVLKRVEGNTAYSASVSKAGFKIDGTDGASEFILTGNGVSAVQDFSIAMAEVANISGTLTGIPDNALKGTLGMALVPEDSTLNTVEVVLNRVEDGSYTFAGTVIVPGQKYSVVLAGANDYEVLQTVVKESGNHADVAIAAQAKPLYTVSGTFHTSDGGQASVKSVTFTNMNEEQYCYTFPVTEGKYTAQLRAGEYKTTADAPGYTAFDHVRVSNQETENIIYLEAPADTSPVPYKAELKVGKGQEFERIAQALESIKRMERTAEERVVIQLTDDLYREQIIIDTPNVSIKGLAEKMPTVTWYYGTGYSYYSIAPATEEKPGFYSEKYAVDQYLKTACDTHWGTTVEVTAAGRGFESENVIYENSFNRYMTQEEVEDGVGEGGDLTKINRSGATDADIKKYVNKERACAMYVYADQCAYENCQFLSSQDTIYTGDGDEHIFYKNCLIEGTTDFICGNGNPVFNGCTLSIYGYGDKVADGGYITASKAGGTQGYLFNHCKIVRTDYAGINTGTKKVYLGRPWGAGTKVLFYDTEVESADLIHPEGYATMANVTPAEAFYQEYNTHTPDGAKLNTADRAAGTTMLTDEQAKAVSVRAYLGNWTPFCYAADYTEVYKAIARAEALNAEAYKDFRAVEAALAAVVTGCGEDEQAKVDAMAAAINKAVDALELKDEENPENPDNPGIPVINVGETAGNAVINAVIDNAAEVEKAVTGMEYTQAEQDAIHNGASVMVHLEINSANPTDEVLSLVSGQFGGKEMTGQYYDIGLLRKVGDLPGMYLHTLNGEITLTMEVPEEIKQAQNGRFHIVRIHNGAVNILEDWDTSADTVTFKTDRFSTYALVYEKAASGEDPLPEPPTEEDVIPEPGDEIPSGLSGTPQTGDLNLAGLFMLLAASGLTAGFTLRKKKEAR